MPKPTRIDTGLVRLPVCGWPTVPLETSEGIISAPAPLIVSASRATDIPAFHSDWFFRRLAEGYCVWFNPFSGRKSYISLQRTKAVVFWSKNPAPMLPRVEELDQHGLCYYFQFTLNDYEKECFEPNVPPLEKRLETFRRLAEKLGPERMVWRFDPIILSESITCDEMLTRFQRLGNVLAGYTKKIVISFIYIDRYTKVRNNLRSLAPTCREPHETEMLYLGEKMAGAAQKWGMKVYSCCTDVDLAPVGIEKSRCVDPDILLRICRDEELYHFLAGDAPVQNLFGEPTLNYKALKDKGQRKPCGCVWSKDIGQYNTCPHFCVYCYANNSRKCVERNEAHFAVDSESILPIS